MSHQPGSQAPPDDGQASTPPRDAHTRSVAERAGDSSPSTSQPPHGEHAAASRESVVPHDPSSNPRAGSPSPERASPTNGAGPHAQPTTRIFNSPSAAHTDLSGRYPPVSSLGQRVSFAESVNRPLPATPPDEPGDDLYNVPVRTLQPRTHLVRPLRETHSQAFPEKPWVPRTLGQRLEPTLHAAKAERNRAARKARISGWAINIAIGLQVTLGTLTTMLSAITVGRETSIVTAVLGGLATLVASYSARVRGTDEPEGSLRRVKDMELFIRECEAFQTDHYHVVDDPHLESIVRAMRRRFEEFMGNIPEPAPIEQEDYSNEDDREHRRESHHRGGGSMA